MGAQSSRWRIAGLILLGGILACTLVHLTADPPLNLSPFHSDYIDEGLYAHSARNKALFGKWDTDEFRPRLVTPTITLVHYAIFSALGVSYATLRIMPILACAVTLVSCFAIVRRLYGPLWGCVSLVLFGANFYFVIFSRQALLEGPVLAFMTLSLLCVYLGRKRGIYYALAAAFGLLAIATKYLHPYALPALAAALALLPLLDPGQRSLRPLGLFLAGLVVSLLALTVLFLAPNWPDLVAYFHNYGPKRLPDDVERLEINLLSEPFWAYFRYRAHLIVALLGLSLPYLGYDLLKKRRVEIVELSCLLWIVAGVVGFSILRYRPARYYFPILTPMVVLGVAGLARFWREERYPLGVDLAGAAMLVSVVFLADMRAPVKALMLGGGLAMALHRLHPWFRARPALARGLSLSLLLVPLGVEEGSKYYHWAAHPRYTLIDTSADLARVIPREGAYVVGKGFNVPLSMESRYRPILRAEMWNHDALKKYRHGYLLDSKQSLSYYKRYFKPILRRMTWIQSYRVMGVDMDLYALPAPPPKGNEPAGKRQKHAPDAPP